MALTEERTAPPECSICCNETEGSGNHDWVALVPCGHVFHNICIDQWILSKNGVSSSRTSSSRAIAAQYTRLEGSEARLRYTCPTRRCKMPLSSSAMYMHIPPSQGIAKDQLQNLKRGYVSLKLGTEQPDDQGGEEKIAQLEHELEKSRDEIAYLEKIYKITEASYIESSALKEERWKTEVGNLQRIIQELKASMRGSRKPLPDGKQVSKTNQVVADPFASAQQQGRHLDLDVGIQRGGNIWSWPTFRPTHLDFDSAWPLDKPLSMYNPNVARSQQDGAPHPGTARYTAAEKGKQRENKVNEWLRDLPTAIVEESTDSHPLNVCSGPSPA